MIGSEAERGGILAGYERVVARLARATVPKIAVVVRKAYGGGHFALGGRPVAPRPAARLADAPRWASWRPTPASAPSTGAGSRSAARRAARRPTTRSWPSSRPSGRHESEPWEAAAHFYPRRRHRPAPDARGDRRPGIDFAWGSGPRLQVGELGGSDAQRPARACLLARPGPRPGDRGLAAILGELDPASSTSRSCVDHWEAGEDVMARRRSSTPAAARSSSSARSTTARSAAGSAKRGEGVHHVCFTAPDLPGAVARLAARREADRAPSCRRTRRATGRPGRSSRPSRATARWSSWPTRTGPSTAAGSRSRTPATRGGSGRRSPVGAGVAFCGGGYLGQRRRARGGGPGVRLRIAGEPGDDEVGHRVGELAVDREPPGRYQW